MTWEIAAGVIALLGFVITCVTAASSTHKHMRIQCGGISNDSIITINEPIE